MAWPKAGHGPDDLSRGLGEGDSPVFKGPWPVPNKVAELPSLATVGRCVHPRNSPGVPGGRQEGLLGPSPWLPKSPFRHTFPGSRTFGRVLIWASPRASRTATNSSLCFTETSLLGPRPPRPRTAAHVLRGPFYRSPPGHAARPCSTAATSWASTSTWRHEKPPENLHARLESSPPNTHAVSGDWGGLVRPGQSPGGGGV